MLNLVNDILDISQMKEGKLKFTYTKFSLKDLFDECFQIMKYQIHSKGLEFNLNLNTKENQIINDE